MFASYCMPWVSLPVFRTLLFVTNIFFVFALWILDSDNRQTKSHTPEYLFVRDRIKNKSNEKKKKQNYEIIQYFLKKFTSRYLSYYISSLWLFGMEIKLNEMQIMVFVTRGICHNCLLLLLLYCKAIKNKNK